jgi:hypothetical protein
MQVTLNETQQKMAKDVGSKRREAAKKRSRPQPHGVPSSADGHKIELLDLDIQSSGAELAVAIATGQKWNSEIINDSLENAPCDVGDNIEVRWSMHPHAHLIIYEENDPDRTYVLVTGNFPNYEIRGYIRGWKGMTPQYWRKTPRGKYAYWISQSELNKP